MGKITCIYINAEKKWWTAEFIGEKKLKLIQEKTETLQEKFHIGFIELIRAIVPVILHVDEGDVWKMTDPKEIEIVYPNK